MITPAKPTWAARTSVPFLEPFGTKRLDTSPVSSFPAPGYTNFRAAFWLEGAEEQAFALAQTASAGVNGIRVISLTPELQFYVQIMPGTLGAVPDATGEFVLKGEIIADDSSGKAVVIVEPTIYVTAVPEPA